MLPSISRARTASPPTKDARASTEDVVVHVDTGRGEGGGETTPSSNMFTTGRRSSQSSMPDHPRRGSVASIARSRASQGSRTSRRSARKTLKRRAAEVKKLDEDRFEYIRGTEQQRIRAMDLKEKLTALERSIEEKNKTMGMYSSLFLTKDTRAKAQRMGRHRAVADNRAIISKHVSHIDTLAKTALNKYNHALDKNQDVKHKINDIRRERQVFTALFKKMEAEIQSKVHAVDELKEQAEHYYRERDAAQRDMREAKTDQDFFLEELAHEGMQVEAAIKADEAATLTAQRKRRASHTSSTHEGGSARLRFKTENANQAKRAAMRKGLNRGAWDITKNKVATMTTQQKLAKYMELWEVLHKGTGVETIQDLIAEFKEMDDAKYNKVAACTALVAEIEVLEGHLRKLQAEWDVLASEEASRAGSRTRVLSTLEGNVESTEKAIADYDKRTGQVTSAIEAMVEPMSRAFQKTGADALLRPENAAQLSQVMQPGVAQSSLKAGVTSSNLTHFASIFEQHANHLIQQYTLLMQHQSEPAHALASTFGPKEPSGKLRQQLQEQYVRIAVLEDDAKDDDMDMDHAAPRPLTHTELKVRAERALERAARGIAERAAAVAAQPHGMARLGATAKARSIRSAMTSTRGRS